MGGKITQNYFSNLITFSLTWAFVNLRSKDNICEIQASGKRLRTIVSQTLNVFAINVVTFWTIP